MERYFVVNEVTSDAKKRVRACSTICNLTNPTDLEYTALLDLTKYHYNSRLNNNAIIQVHENPKRLMSKLTEYCDFGEAINKMLRDKFVSELTNT